VGVGEIVNVDEKGRIIIPDEVRRAIGKRTFRVEVAGKDTIVLRAVADRRDLVERVAGIRLAGDRERASVDAAAVKDLYGGKSLEDH